MHSSTIPAGREKPRVDPRGAGRTAICKKLAERAPKEIPNWPAMTVIEKPINNDYSKTYKNMLVFEMSGRCGGRDPHAYGPVGVIGKGLMSCTVVTLKDSKGDTLWQKYFPYISSKFGRGKNVDEAVVVQRRLRSGRIPWKETPKKIWGCWEGRYRWRIWADL